MPTGNTKALTTRRIKYTTTNNKHTKKKKNQGYTSTLKECIKTDDRFQYMDQKLMSHKYLKKND